MEGEADLGTSKPSQFAMAFPPYRRSLLRSQTYHTLVHILSHLTPSNIPTHPLNIPDNGSGRMGQQNQEKQPECSELKVGSDFMDRMGPVPQKEIHEVHETIEGVGDKSRDASANKMVLDDLELLMGREEPSAQTNGFHWEKKLMDELELVVKGSEDPICDQGLIPLNSGLGVKQNSGSEVDLMDYQVAHVEFLHSDANTSGYASELLVPGELNQLTSEDFHGPTSTKGQASALVITTSSLNQESQQKETELATSVCPVVASLPLTEEGGVEKEEQYGQKVAEATHISLDRDSNIEALNMSENVGILDSTILKDKHEKQNVETFCVNNATNSSNILIEGGPEEGEISGDFEMDVNSFNVSSADTLISEQMKVDEVQKTENVLGNMVYPCKIGNGEKEKGCQSNNSFIVNTLQVANSNGQVEPRNSNKNGIACGIELATSRETIEFDKAGDYDSVLKPESSNDRYIGSKGINDMPTYLTRNQVLYSDLWEETTTKNRGNSSAVKMVDACRAKRSGSGSKKKKNKKKVNDASTTRKCVPDSEEKEDKNKVNDASTTRKCVLDSEKEDKNKNVDISRSKKRGRGSEEKKDKKKMKYRKQRAEKNRELGVKRLKLLPVQKPKTISYCRHYIKGRCHEGDKCNFSHDTVPSTKSKPCVHFARHSCMKGDDCPFDHQLSKYPCNNFVTKGSCSRGDTCLFSHQVPTNQKDIPKPANVCKPESKSPLLSGNTNISLPLNNRGCNYVQQNHFANSNGMHSHINAEHKVTDTPQAQPTSAPKGIRFINVASLTPSPSTPKQDTVTPKKQSVVQNGTCTDQGASGTTQNIAEIPKKLPDVTPKGINFLSFGKGPVCSFKSSISSHLNRESGIKLTQSVTFGLPEQASSSLNKDYHGKISDRTKNLPQTTLFSHEDLDKNQSMAEGNKLKFPVKDLTDNSMRDHSHCNSVQEGKKASDNSQTSGVTSAMIFARPFLSHQSSECLVSGYHKQTSNSGHRALLSTLAFAAEHESDIKIKCPAGTSAV